MCIRDRVKRYRNSPSIILWSVGNEEWQLQNAEAEQGAKIGATMVKLCHELDPTRVVSAAVNGDNEKGVSDAFDIIGFNYGLNRPDGLSLIHIWPHLLRQRAERPQLQSRSCLTFAFFRLQCPAIELQGP